MPDNRITWTPMSSTEFQIVSNPFIDRNEMSLDLCNQGDGTQPREIFCSNLTVEAATRLRDLLDANLKVLAAAQTDSADRLAHLVAVTLESDGRVISEDERARIAEVLRHA
jgi:hypothetical protein